MCTKPACILHQLGESQLWLRTTQPHQPLTGLIASAALTMGLLQMRTQLPAPICARQVAERGEMPGLGRQRHAAWRRVCSHRSGSLLAMATEALGVAALQLHCAPRLLSLSGSPLPRFGLFLSVSGGKFLPLLPESEGKKKSYEDDCNLISQTMNPSA